MTGRKSIYERFALKQKVSMAKKSAAMRTLREELARINSIKDQLEALAEDTAIKPGATTGMQMRSASWYGAQVQEQLTTLSNRSDFLGEEVEAQEMALAMERYRHELSVQKAAEFRKHEREVRAEKAAALLPARTKRTQ